MKSIFHHFEGVSLKQIKKKFRRWEPDFNLNRIRIEQNLNRNENKNLDWINFKYLIFQVFKIKKEIKIEIS